MSRWPLAFGLWILAVVVCKNHAHGTTNVESGERRVYYDDEDDDQIMESTLSKESRRSYTNTSPNSLVKRKPEASKVFSTTELFKLLRRNKRILDALKQRTDFIDRRVTELWRLYGEQQWKRQEFDAKSWTRGRAGGRLKFQKQLPRYIDRHTFKPFYGGSWMPSGFSLYPPIYAPPAKLASILQHLKPFDPRQPIATSYTDGTSNWNFNYNPGYARRSGYERAI